MAHSRWQIRGAIVLYLADRYKPGDLAPALDDPDRGEFLFWLFYAPSVMEPAMTEKFVDIPENPSAYPWGSFDKMVHALESRMTGRDWIATDRFTMADFMIAGTLQAMVTFNILDPSPVLKSYMDRCLSRPAAISGEKKKAAAVAEAERGRPQS